MRSHRVGMVEIDHRTLRDELERTKTFDFVEPYEEFLCGRKTKLEGQIMLWAPGGDSGDGNISHYDEEIESAPTEYGRQLPYLARLIEQTLSLRHLRFARLVALTSNVLVPHRDYLEFETSEVTKRPVHRLHIPLVTNPRCLFTDDNTVYHMKAGEVWFLDATRVHSAGAFTDELRMHLIVDFSDVDDESTLLNIETDGDQGIPESSIVVRPPISDDERHALRSLAPVLTFDNIREVFAIIAKTHFRRDGGEDFFWSTVEEIRRGVTDPALATHLTKLHDYFVLSRPE